MQFLYTPVKQLRLNILQTYVFGQFTSKQSEKQRKSISTQFYLNFPKEWSDEIPLLSALKTYAKNK